MSSHLIPATANSAAIRVFECGCAYSAPNGLVLCVNHVSLKGQPSPRPPRLLTGPERKGHQRVGRLRQPGERPVNHRETPMA